MLAPADQARMPLQASLGTAADWFGQRSKHGETEQHLPSRPGVGGDSIQIAKEPEIEEGKASL